MKGKFVNWWSSLSKAAKIAISAGGVVVISSAVVFPTLAFTVWKKEADYVIELEYYDSAYELSTANPVDLKKDKVYLFKADLSTFEGSIEEYYSHPFRIIIMNDKETYINKIVTDFSIKYNGKKLVKFNEDVTEATSMNVPANQYAYCTTDDGSIYVGGANTLPSTGKWGKMEFKFKCIKDLPGCTTSDISIRFNTK